MWVELLSNGTVSVRHNLTNADVACSGCSKVAGASGYSPAGTLKMLDWGVTSDTFDTGVGNQYYPGIGSTQSITPGTGLTGDGFLSPLAIDTAVVPTKLSSTASLDFASTANGACATDLTFTLTGAVTGDFLAPQWPTTGDTGWTGIMWVSASNTVTVRYCNHSGGTINPSAQTFGAMVIR